MTEMEKEDREAKLRSLRTGEVDLWLYDMQWLVMTNHDDRSEWLERTAAFDR